ncbi:hypothetical protein M011DRAFT_324431 [Sporormia fimetaria CBS 119925]|uniref:Uncharacterized protein n=1 Tax=Sporormia fimetaria CBS 119925 TaxID=1340428 RepID=A0A6A6VHL4_9PLEO|nr:hypothetical protein M011DRAFT_324431 [Sporormia fimetaria CBS 119925]
MLHPPLAPCEMDRRDRHAKSAGPMRPQGRTSSRRDKARVARLAVWRRPQFQQSAPLLVRRTRRETQADRRAVRALGRWRHGRLAREPSAVEDRLKRGSIRAGHPRLLTIPLFICTQSRSLCVRSSLSYAQQPSGHGPAGERTNERTNNSNDSRLQIARFPQAHARCVTPARWWASVQSLQRCGGRGCLHGRASCHRIPRVGRPIRSSRVSSPELCSWPYAFSSV